LGHSREDRHSMNSKPSIGGNLAKRTMQSPNTY